MRLDDIVEMGYTKTGQKYGDYEIWGKENSRVLLNHHQNRVMIEYNAKSPNGIAFEELYVSEVN